MSKGSYNQQFYKEGWLFSRYWTSSFSASWPFKILILILYHARLCIFETSWSLVMLCTTFSNSNKLRKSNKGVAIYNSLKCLITSIFFRGNHSLASASGIFDNYHKLCSFCSHKETHIFAPPLINVLVLCLQSKNGSGKVTTKKVAIQPQKAVY